MQKLRVQFMILKTDWKLRAYPKETIDLEFTAFFDDLDAEVLLNGIKPESMDDKWFVYSENGWVYFVRSWTGAYIYGIKLHPTPAGGSKVIESWVTGNADDYRCKSVVQERELLSMIIKFLFKVESHA